MMDTSNLIFRTGFVFYFVFYLFKVNRRITVFNQLRTGLNCCLDLLVAERKCMCPCTFLSSSVNIWKVIISQLNRTEYF